MYKVTPCFRTPNNGIRPKLQFASSQYELHEAILYPYIDNIFWNSLKIRQNVIVSYKDL